MSVSVTEIDGANIVEVVLEAFTPAAIIVSRGETLEEYRRNEDDASIDCVIGICLTHVGHGQTVVSLFNHDGEAVHYIGPTDVFQHIPNIGEEAAYNNYHDLK